MFTDYHSHILPEMDDGAPDTDTSLKMIGLLRDQGIERIAATSHYYRHRETPREFSARREKALSLIKGKHNGAVILPGAEVSLERGLASEDGLYTLALNNTHILLELPWTNYKSWMAEEIYNTAYRFKLKPIIAHLERYLQMYKKSDMLEVLSIPGAVIQINNEALEKRPTRGFALELIRTGYPVVFGSDAHNMESRPPDFARALKTLRAKLDGAEYSRLLELNEHLF